MHHRRNFFVDVNIRTTLLIQSRMCDIPSGVEQSLEVPTSMVNIRDGFGIDCGCSAVKIVYILNDGKYVRFHFATYPRERIEDALDHLKENIKDKLDPKGTYHTTGVGGGQFHDIIEKKLGVQVNNLLEMECIPRGLNFLAKNYSLKDLVFPESKEVMAYATTIATQMKALVQSWKNEAGSTTDFEDLGTVSSELPDKIQFPLTLVQLGSGSGAVKFDENGKMEITASIIPYGGRFMMGMASLLTGAKTYEKFMKLAQEGDAGKVTVLANQLDTTGAAYPEMNLAMTVFPFGHCIGKNIEDHKREDIAAALLALTGQSIGIISHNMAVMMKTNQVLFAGGLCNNSQLTRNEIGKHFALSAMNNQQGIYTHHRFLKLGSYLGCLGALLKSVPEPSVESN